MIGHRIFFLVFVIINTYLYVYHSFVQEHKYSLVTAREARKIDGGFNEGECGGGHNYGGELIWTNLT